ncbi:hypothetical protein GCM10010264_66990 [Streptomyces globisporus]|nr:hypothetical protein GCM10010264_66990 [Streptomyces globisporus]
MEPEVDGTPDRAHTSPAEPLHQLEPAVGDPQEVTADQTAGMPAVLASAVRELVAETDNRLADELLAHGSLDWLRAALGEGKA